MQLKIKFQIIKHLKIEFIATELLNCCIQISQNAVKAQSLSGVKKEKMVPKGSIITSSSATHKANITSFLHHIMVSEINHI